MRFGNLRGALHGILKAAKQSCHLGCRFDMALAIGGKVKAGAETWQMWGDQIKALAEG